MQRPTSNSIGHEAQRCDVLEVQPPEPTALALRQALAREVIPILGPDGEAMGEIIACAPASKSIPAIAEVAGRVLWLERELARERSRAQRAEELSMRDALTGLFNRRGWDFMLEAEEKRCRRNSSPACVLSVDLDNLKATNDTLGHEEGDRLLIRAAEAIKDTIRSSDIAARVGGDEFAVLAPECNPNAAGRLVKRLRERFATAGVEASIGVAPRDDAGLHAAWNEADQRMRVEKRLRKSR